MKINLRTAYFRGEEICRPSAKSSSGYQKIFGKLILNGFINNIYEKRGEEKPRQIFAINETKNSANEFICVISFHSRSASELKQPEKSSQHFIDAKLSAFNYTETAASETVNVFIACMQLVLANDH